MSRRQDWPERLDACLAAARHKSFEWGRFDCALFVADCVEAMTDLDPAADLRGHYDDRAGAAAALREFGYVGLEALAAARSEARIEPAMAWRGDVALIETAVGPALGIVLGAYIVCAGPEGLTYLPRASAPMLAAFRV